LTTCSAPLIWDFQHTAYGDRPLEGVGGYSVHARNQLAHITLV
jgi:hypothetical protein